ncbi:hypothetical protein RHMOL_Rhmol02G0057500 [Rhododendron molle]|uniref:Uncharacterized protein n=1 Tax=Rhododendron molle TaxID=49168 RepID=A0ACC0PLP1_RHOML|nr:hypothetical protein RHMOL_Rhmol02G0057500 [Rhododendron molle]
MSYLRAYGIFLALALITAMHQLPPVESLVLVAGKVRISNQFPSPLVLHCNSDHYKIDLGNQTVRGGSFFEWNISVVVGKSNVYSCVMYSRNKVGDFVLFDPEKDVSSEVCGFKNFFCDWQLRNGGLFLFYTKRREYVLRYPF